ncbi:MAG: sensor domain-containing diguanylate cyclase [Marinagarivorans sp.]|nr:sensor domain-containing diguanylate cyclase [Marinagarivorans sp.]
MNARIHALLVMGFGILNLIGIAFGQQSLLTPFPFSPPMSLTAACSLSLLGGALVLNTYRLFRPAKLLCWLQLASLPSFWIVHVTLETAGDWHVLPESALLSLATFALFGVLLLNLRTLPQTHIALFDWLLTCFSCVPLLSIFAYIFDPAEMYKSYFYWVLPVPTAVALIVSFFALVSQTDSKGAAGILTRDSHYARNFQRLFLLVLVVPLSVGSGLALAVDMGYLRAGFAAAIFCLFATLLIASVLVNNAIVQESWLRRFIREQHKNSDLQNHISEVLEISPDAILLLNDQLDVLHANRGAATLFGWNQENLQNINFGTLIPPQHFKRFERLVKRFFKSRRLTLTASRPINAMVQNRLGELIPISLNLSKRRAENARHIVALMRNNTDVANKIYDLEQQLRIDTLTGAGSRAEFENYCQKLSRHQRKGDTLVAIFILDLDNFKHINDTYGHPAGDRVLQTFSHTTQNCLRNGDQLFRIGGEEFAIVANQIEATDANLLADRIRTIIKSKPMVAGPNNLYVTCSIGVCITAPANIEEAISEADKALYIAKRNGKDQVVVVGENP